MIASYCPKKGWIVKRLVTMHSLPDTASNSAEQNPEVILFYNSTKRGVDTLDGLNILLQEDDQKVVGSSILQYDQHKCC